MARNSTSSTPITHSTWALQYVFQIVETAFLKMENWAIAVNPYQYKNRKTAGRENAGKSEYT
jgi:hypothetical protein